MSDVAGEASGDARDLDLGVVEDADAGAIDDVAADVSMSDEAPRPIAPLSTSTVTSLRPTLRWALPPGITRARVELCRDRACTTVVATLEGTDRATVTSDLSAGWMFWRVSSLRGATVSSGPSATWQFYVGPRGTTVDRSYGSVLDVNGDGLRDVAIAAPQRMVGLVRNAGSALVYYGARSGLPATESWRFDGASSDESVGLFVADAGDVNGDGFSDLAVSARDGANAHRGLVRIFHGGPTGLSAMPATSIPGVNSNDLFGFTSSAVGDLNGDGYGDFAVHTLSAGTMSQGAVSFYLGSATGLRLPAVAVFLGAQPRERFGMTVAAAGDINGDGYSDVVIGREGASSSFDYVPVYFGREAGISPTPALTLRVPVPELRLGVALCAGDFNGDGFSDVVVGSPAQRRLLIHYGDGATLPPSATTPISVSMLAGAVGSVLSSFGDMNGDGFDDFASASNTNSVVAATWFGNALPSPLAGPVVMPREGVSSLGGRGDTDGDGRAELLAGSPNALVAGMSTGMAFLYRGTTLGLDLAAPRSFSGVTPLERFGEALH
ncbi:MAG: FG-GAP-like repeat-containing protein [Polyangiales bacterium]